MTTNKRGIELLHDPSLNKSTAFTEAEKQAPRNRWPRTRCDRDRRPAIKPGDDATRPQDHGPRSLHLPDQPARPQRNPFLSDCNVGSSSLSADRLRPDHRGSLPASSLATFIVGSAACIS